MVVMVCGLEVVVREVEAKAGGGGEGWCRVMVVGEARVRGGDDDDEVRVDVLMAYLALDC